jgi:COPII coat assembly protein SEC16
MPQVAKQSTDDAESFGITASSLATSTAPQTTVDPAALATYNLTNDFLRSVRDRLIQGDRQGAIQKAVDQKMWGHALLIASSVSPAVWRDTSEQFIRYELRETGVKDFDSLRFLYGVLGNEGIDAVTELLPPANRMVSSIHTSSTSQGPRLTSWKESLGMVLANKRSVDDPAPIVGLGNALVKDGRVEAGHAWYLSQLTYSNHSFLLSKSALFAAIDMPETQYTLLGGDHAHGKSGLVGLPQIMLSEIFEYSQTKFIPEGFMHLLPYKIWHAWTLSDYGYTDLSEKYCESIGATLQKEKKGSVFVTPYTISVLKDLTERIAEGPQRSFTEKSSWFGKMSTKGGDNFWKALETNLANFVAGDEALEETTQGVPAKKSLEVQDSRFGRIASETALNRMTSMPNLRAQATTPIYGSFPQEVGRTPGSHSRYSTNTSETRYAPGARYDYQAVQEEIPDYEDGAATLAPPPAVSIQEPINRGYSPYAALAAPAPPRPAEAHHYAPPEPKPEPIKEEKPIAEQEEPAKPASKTKEEEEKKGSSFLSYF